LKAFVVSLPIKLDIIDRSFQRSPNATNQIIEVRLLFFRFALWASDKKANKKKKCEWLNSNTRPEKLFEVRRKKLPVRLCVCV